MASEILNKIIKNYGSKFSDDLIKHDIYSRFNKDDFDAIKTALSLKEQRLSRIECFSCDEKCDIKFNDKVKFIHCIKCDAGRVNLNKEQDLAYFLEFDKLADFVANLVGIKANKNIIKLKELVYLGDLKLGKNKGLSCSFYLSKITQVDFVKQNIKVKNNNISFVINLTSRKLDLDQESFVESDLQNIIFYNKKLKKFNFNEIYFTELMTPFITKHDEGNKFSILKEANKKYAKGGKQKAEVQSGEVKKYVLSEYKKLKNKNSSKKKISKTIMQNIYNLPPKTFPVIPVEDVIYRWLPKLGK